MILRAMSLSGLCLATAGTALGQDMPRQVAFGRALFQGSTGFAAGVNATRPPLPAQFAACANCHGAQGIGTQEGGTKAPPINAAALSSLRGGGYASGAAVLAAITEGEGRGGQTLAPQMPRYRLNPAEQDALLDYLQVVGTPRDLPPGVSETEVRLATLLPLSGPRAAQGRAMLDGMEPVIAAVNRAGGVHGRTVALKAIDSADAAHERALRSQDIFAIIGGMWDDRDLRIEATLVDAKVPVIASLIFRAPGAESGPWTADLLPPEEVQAALLLSSLSQCPVPVSGTRWLIAGGDRPVSGVNRVFPTAADLADASPAGPARGCIGFPLRDIAAAEPAIPSGWNRRIGLPFPRQVLDHGAGAIWQTLGTASARIAVEALAASGAALHERALLDALPHLNGFEPLPGAPVRYSARRHYGWDADVLAQDFDDPTQTLTTASDLAAHQED